MHQEERERWIKGVIISAVVFSLFSVYLFLRRGYYNLYIVNKVFGSTAAVVAGLTLVIGPLARSFTFFARLMAIRRQLGLLAFALAIAHVIASLTLQNKFAFPSWYVSEWLPVLFGLLAIGVWSYMTYISRNSKIKAIGADVWKRRLSLAGKVGFIAIFLHLAIMKYPGWIKWWQGQVKQTPELANPSYPPASIFVFFIMVMVIVYRLARR